MATKHFCDFCGSVTRLSDLNEGMSVETLFRWNRDQSIGKLHRSNLGDICDVCLAAVREVVKDCAGEMHVCLDAMKKEMGGM